MQKPGKIVIKETVYIATIVIILSIIMQSIFILFGSWDYTVVLGNILTAVFAVVNFLLMGITVEKAVEKDEKEARAIIKTSQSLRQLMLLAVAAVGAIAPCFNLYAVIIPLLFPRIAISLKPLFVKNN